MAKWTLENNVNDWVKAQFAALGLLNREHYGEESSMSDKLRQALAGGSKTRLKTGSGKPDFHIENYTLPVLIEDKLGIRKLSAKQNQELKMDEKSIQQYATNGAVAYAQAIIASGRYSEAIAVGIAGDDEANVDIEAYYVHSAGTQPKLLTEVQRLNFLENEAAFNEMHRAAKLTDKERHEILIESRAVLQSRAKTLNKLMNNHSINVEQRVVYVSGCLLAMQDVRAENGDLVKEGLKPDQLTGVKSESDRDGKKVLAHIQEYFEKSHFPADRMELLMGTFRNSIANDPDRDEQIEVDPLVSSLMAGRASLNKQIFSYIYEYIFRAIDATSGHLDIVGEMYSEFLKYASRDGKDIGIVLTPPYVTKLMVEILDIDENDRVMDLATGSAGFLISAMAHMVQRVENIYGRETTEAKTKIAEIKSKQLLGVELDAKMFALATTNMSLRGDTSTNIQKGSSFERPAALYQEFNATRLLLNPPFSHAARGMPFIEFGLKHMAKHGRAAIIVQDSAGSGQAVEVNKQILKNNLLLASIKMPADLFLPSAGVQTSIYVFEAGVPHDFERTVKFIDFRNDGYKRTSRGLGEVDSPTERYEDIIKIYKAGANALIPAAHASLWDLDSVYIEDQITNSGADWNFDQHRKRIEGPTGEDFAKTVSEYLAWDISQLLRGVDK